MYLISLFSISRWLFWTDWGEDPKIERAGMDGSHRQTVVRAPSVRWPNGVAVDLTQDRIYWVDAKTNTVREKMLEKHSLEK